LLLHFAAQYKFLVIIIIIKQEQVIDGLSHVSEINKISQLLVSININSKGNLLHKLRLLMIAIFRRRSLVDVIALLLDTMPLNGGWFSLV